MSIKKYLLAIFLSFFALNIFLSAAETRLLFTISKEFKARLGVINSESHSLEVEILNNDGDVFFSKSISRGQNYFQLLDLTSMPDGAYSIKLVGFSSETLKEFNVSNHKAVLVKKVKAEKPSFHLIDEEVLMVSFYNVNDKVVNIFFEVNDEVVFEDRNITGKIINKKYSLKKLPKGDYTVKFYSEGEIYTYPLVIK